MWQSVYRISESAINSLLRFLRYFFQLLNNTDSCSSLNEVSAIPITSRTAEKTLGIHSNDIIEYVVCPVCPVCHSIYKHSECMINQTSGNKEPKLCQYVRYPNHPNRSRQKICGTALLKQIKSKSGIHLVPALMFPYLPLRVSLQRLVSRPGFLSLCEQWRERNGKIPCNVLGDIYDGQIWKDFSKSFLSTPCSYMLGINVDWFQPFKHTEYSMGAIYLVIQNLPRSERYKEENVILVGLLPGPKEPKVSINSYLIPLVQELHLYYFNGLTLTSPQNTSVTIRVMLSCVSCDIPASRKLCGFLGHNAKLGCNKCYKQFNVNPGGVSDFSGYDRGTWLPRTAEKHRENCIKISKEVTKTAICQAESLYGVRVSALLDLTYFDPIRFVAIDVMHNLLLGTAKHIFKLWLSTGIINKHHLQDINIKCKNFVVPSNIGRLPLNISSNYGGFTASQWCTWTVVYSPVVLKDILPSQHLHCWLLFVRACRLLTQQRFIAISDVHTADRLLEIFCKKCEDLYGKDSCTPNMHLHLHLKKVFLDFGPAHAFWCFSFERYNGVLGAFHSNKKSIELQFMKQFMKKQLTLAQSTLTDTEFHQFFPRINSSTTFGSHNSSTTLANSVNSDSQLMNVLKLSHSAFNPPEQSFADFGLTKLLPPVREQVFDSDKLSDLTALYQQLHPFLIVNYVSPFHNRSGRVAICGDVIGSLLDHQCSIIICNCSILA